MTRRWRARTLLFPLLAATLIAAVLLAAGLGRAFLFRRLDNVLPADELAALIAEFAHAMVPAYVLAALLAAVLTAIIGVLLVRPLVRLRSDALARAKGEAGTIHATPVAEAANAAAAVELLHREAGRHSEKLRRERDEFAALVATVSEGILQISASGRVLHANPAARSLLGLPNRVDGQAIAALVRNVELRMLLERAASGGTLATCEVSLDDRRLLVAARPLTDGDGEAGVVVALSDLTEVRRLESVRRDFVANVSHELKTPLTSIRGYVETLMSDELPADMEQQFLEVIHRNAERLHHIVDDLLDLSRLESGGWRPELQTVDPAAIAREAWAACSERADRKQIRFHVEAGAERVLADPAGLRQVLANLFDNSVRYTPEGGSIAVRIRPAARTATPTGPASSLSAPEADGAPGSAGDGDVAAVLIEVADTGSGIPHDSLPRIFERFYRVDPARSRADGGTGLGLSIVKHLVDRMGGSVSVASELGRGTTQRIHLPAPGARSP